MAWPELEYSKSQVKRAGKILREHHTQILSQSEDDVAWATSVARNWRHRRNPPRAAQVSGHQLANHQANRQLTVTYMPPPATDAAGP